MNIHVKIWDCNQPDDKPEEIVSLIRKYDCEKHVYFMTTNDAMIRKVMKYAPDLKCCVGWDGNEEPLSMVDRAIELGAYKIQLFTPKTVTTILLLPQVLTQTEPITSHAPLLLS